MWLRLSRVMVIWNGIRAWVRRAHMSSRRLLLLLLSWSYWRVDISILNNMVRLGRYHRCICWRHLTLRHIHGMSLMKCTIHIIVALHWWGKSIINRITCLWRRRRSGMMWWWRLMIHHHCRRRWWRWWK